ncbi:MAG: LON peptidase substrate-binding domain-containing protein [Jatrophihabitans sp.]
MADTVPIFPLQFVLLPGMPLPLHIFEPRYRQLVADVTAVGQSPCFGVVALRRGGETDHDVDLAEVGTVAEIVEREPYPDGRVDLLTVGTRRFRVVSVQHGVAPYMCAEIEWLPEEFGSIDASLLGAVRRECRQYLSLLASLGVHTEDDLSHDPLKLSYEVAAHLQLPMAERVRLLSADTVADRLREECDLLRRELALLTATHAVPVSPQSFRSVFGDS